MAAAALMVAGVAGLFSIDRGGETVTAGGSQDFSLTLDGHRDWFLAVLNRQIEPTDEAFRSRYSDSFLAAVPPDEFRQALATVSPMGPWRQLEEIERRGETILAVQLAAPGKEQSRLTFALGNDGRVQGSTILMATHCAEAVDPAIPLSPGLAQQLAWVQELLGSDREVSDEELQARFAPSFLSSVSPDKFRAGLVQLRELGPYSLRGFEGAPLAASLAARVGVRSGEEARLTLSVEASGAARISGLEIRTQQPCRIGG